LEEIRDKNSQYPRMIPSPDEFEVHMSQLGLHNDDIIVIYDSAGVFSAPRVWYMFKAMGAKNVCLLNGGFPLWRKENRPIEEGPMTGAYQTEKKAFTARFNRFSIADLGRIKRIVAGTEDALIVDARSPDRFSGKLKETNPALRSGHIPGSVSLYYELLLDDTKMCYRSVSELRSIFEKYGIDIKKNLSSPLVEVESRRQLYHLGFTWYSGQIFRILLIYFLH